jgi:uncharacterized protein
MTSSVNRRTFLGGAMATGMGIVITGSIDAVAGSGSALAAPRSFAGYGALVPDPKKILALPPGFSYRVVSETGVTDTVDGVRTASDPDGTGVFANGAGSTIVNNHEIGGTETYPVPALPGLTYDEGPVGARRASTSTRRATGSANTPAWPAPTTTVPAESRRGARG